MKAWFQHDLMAKNPEDQKKIKGLIIEHGYNCLESCWCDHGNSCPHRSTYRYHNWCCKVQTFFRYKMGWKGFTIPIYFQRHSSDLSGTDRCPYHMPRVKTCWKCKFAYGGQDCTNKERLKLIREGRVNETELPGQRRICKFFEPDEWFEKYDRHTGDSTWD